MRAIEKPRSKCIGLQSGGIRRNDYGIAEPGNHRRRIWRYDDNLEYRRRHCGPSLCFGGWQARNTFRSGSDGIGPGTLDQGGENV